MRDHDVIGSKIKLADSFFARLIGLMRKKELLPQEGLLLTRCRQIHTFFMLIAIDVVFMDKDGRIIELFSGMPPGKVSPNVKEACQVLELPEGMIRNYSLERGMILKLAKPDKNLLNVR